MASVSVSHMILFIASIIVAASVAGVFTNSINQVSQAIDEAGLSVSEDVRTDVEIISDSGSNAVYDASTNTIVLHVKNTGSETLPPDADVIDVFVDGRYATNVSLTVLGGEPSWVSGEVVRLNVTQRDDLGAGDHRVKIIINNDEEVFEFRL
jgi:flagellar protein FlaG